MGQALQTSNMIVCGVVDEDEEPAARDSKARDWFMCHKLVFCHPLTEIEEKTNRIIISDYSHREKEAITGSFLIYKQESYDDENATAKKLCNAPFTCAEIEPNPDIDLEGPPEPLLAGPPPPRR